LAVGCISAREIFARAAKSPTFAGCTHRLLWREFHRMNAICWGRRLFWLQGPGYVERPWSWDYTLSQAWQDGKTGIPYIDACMRELKQTGWLAYKGRKTTAFFLVFGLGIDWRLGAFYFEEVLLDYDVAMNYGNWVVVAEVDKHKRGRRSSDRTSLDELVKDRREDLEWKLTSERVNDPEGSYLRRWLPELAAVADEHVHTPWKMTQQEMEKCGCLVGADYPAPLLGPLEILDAVEAQKAPERRVHPEDESGRAYTYREFIEYHTSKGNPAEAGQRQWDGAVPVGADR